MALVMASRPCATGGLDWPAATVAMVALAEHGIEADIRELLTPGNPSREVSPGAIFSR